MGETTRYRFISGLPRSGSTLLAALLGQNPRFRAGMSSPVAGLADAVIAQVSAGSELHAMVDRDARRRLVRSLFDAYYAEAPEPVIFDTNRSWTAKLPALAELFPDARVICMVRDVAWILDSLERRFRADPFEHTRLFASAAERATVYTRVEALTAADRVVGYPWHALREACFGEHAGRLMIVDYDLLTRRPAEVMALVYRFLEEPPFDHDFERVAFDAPAFDAQLGMGGLHRVRDRVAPAPRETVLPPDLFERYARLSFWKDLAGSRAWRIVSEGDAETAEVGAAGQGRAAAAD
ncbi:sulfotransferase [Albimonas sp. CAU 1670]|uniref:sulfotransferase family protein n=1 Tax=Albimonas sp. CAU 1670 TaxID=3032599 RepID=UPI0023DA2D9D|nr:sulfotransferase [Albimonas sp. CAU 1670]MDF2235353.1 sulfotransferase [Albimonas sp. CAU 1670]